LGSRLIQLQELCLRGDGICLHTLQSRVDFVSTFSREFVGGGAKFVDCFAPSVHLGGGLKFKRRLLLLDLRDEFASALSIGTMRHQKIEAFAEHLFPVITG